MSPGQVVDYSITVSAVSGTWVVQQGGNINPVIVSFSSPGTYSGSYTAVANDSATAALAIKLLSVGPGSLTITAITLRYRGALTAPAYQATSTVRDLTARGATDSNQGRLVGVTPILLDAQSGSVIKNPSQAFTAATSVQILGGAITGANKQRIVSITGNSSASTTLSVGTSTGGTQLVNAQAVNGDFDIGTFVSRFLAANSSIWLTFAANTTAYVTINTSDL
jgi:hypothetical protein